MHQNKRCAFYTLGCKVNQYDTQSMIELFKSGGYEIVDFDDFADVYVINTCTVTGEGDRKSRQIVRRASRINPEAVIAVTGCYAQTSPGEVLGIPGVDIVVGTQGRKEIVSLVEQAADSKHPIDFVRGKEWDGIFEEIPIEGMEERSRATLKIQEGCENFCSYCKIPYARGPVRSRALENVIGQAKRLADSGYKEIVLTGIHLGAYGRDFAEPLELADAIEAVSAVDGLERIRLSSVEPTDITDRLLKVMTNSPRVCRHLHIPLQSGDNEILRLMNRKYSVEDYRETICKVREAIPEIALTTDVIAGFPGEKDMNFDNTYSFIREMGFSRMHVFKYSKREGTPAAGFEGQVTSKTKEKRVNELIKLGREMASEFNGKLVGGVHEVLIEQRDDDSGLMEGLTDTYVKVVFNGECAGPGELVDVKIMEACADYVKGVC